MDEKLKMYSKVSFFGLLALTIPIYYRKIRKTPLLVDSPTFYTFSQVLFFGVGAQLAYTT